MAADLVDQQRIDENDRKICTDTDKRNINGVPKITVRTQSFGIEDISKVFQPDKFAARYPGEHLVLLKSDKDTEHRAVIENTDEHEGRKQKQIHHPMPLYVADRFAVQNIFQPRTYVVISIFRPARSGSIRCFHEPISSFRCCVSTLFPRRYR